MIATTRQRLPHDARNRRVAVGLVALLIMCSLGIYNSISPRPLLFMIARHGVLYVPLGWQVYRDPAGNFSTELRRDWHGSMASDGTAGTESTYIVHSLWPDPQQTVFRPSNLRGFIVVNRYPISTVAARDFVCQTTAQWPRNRTIAGLPATDDHGAVIVITKGAIYEISTKFYYSPGGQEHKTDFPDVSAIYQQMAVSFALTDNTPLAC